MSFQIIVDLTFADGALRFVVANETERLERIVAFILLHLAWSARRCSERRANTRDRVRAWIGDRRLRGAANGLGTTRRADHRRVMNPAG